MTQLITIEALKVEGFRAYLQPQTLNFYRGKTPLSLAIFAPNAKGKSSLVDGFEFYFSKEATLRRLGQRAFQRYAGPGAMEHVNAKDSGVVPAIHFWFREGKEKFDASRLISLANSPLPEAATRVLESIKLPFIIRGHELRSFVEKDTPEERYKEVAAWFALDPLLEIQQSLRSLRRKVKQKVEAESETKERLRDLEKITNKTVTTWDELKICAWFNTNVLAHLDDALKLSDLTNCNEGYLEICKRKSLEDEQLGLAALKRLSTQIEALFKSPEKEEDMPTGNIITLEEVNNSYIAAVSKETQERSKASQAVFNEVWASAKKLFEKKDAEFMDCPVCDTTFKSSPHRSREQVSLNLDAKLKNLADYRDAEAKLKNLKVSLDEATRNLKASFDTAYFSLKEAGFEDKAKNLYAYIELVNEWKMGDKTPDSLNAVKELQLLYSSLYEEKERIERQQGEHTYGKALIIVKKLHQVKADLQRIRQTKEELKTLHKNLNNQALIINKAIGEHTQNLITKLQKDINFLFKEIQRGDDVPNIRLELPEEGETNQQRIQLLIDFAENRKGVVPSGYLSDSQIHTLALSMRLSAIRRFNDRFPVIVLDDVVTSYDADHRKNIAAMLATHFKEFQIIIVTHDEQFFKLLEDHLDRPSWMIRRIIKIQPGFGPKFHDHRTSDKEIQVKLDAGESAAEEIRQVEEEWLLDICRGFGVKVVIRSVQRPYKFERSELADALANFLKNVGIVPPEVPGVSNPFLGSLRQGIIENFASHFSDNPYQTASVGDDKTRWMEFEFFRNQFVCSGCGSRRFKRPGSLKKPVCDKCEQPFAFPN